MSKLSYKVSYYALYAMFAIILIVLGLFYLGGDAQGADVIAGVDPEMWQPANNKCLTDAHLWVIWFGCCCYSSCCCIPIWSSFER